MKLFPHFYRERRAVLSGIAHLILVKRNAPTTPSELRDVTGISETEKNAIKTFMQGAVYCWVKNRKRERFAVRDLMGGDNFEWEDTPLQVLYEKHIAQGKSNDAAIESAGKDLGWLVKTMLSDDKRTFEPDKGRSGQRLSLDW